VAIQQPQPLRAPSEHTPRLVSRQQRITRVVVWAPLLHRPLWLLPPAAVLHPKPPLMLCNVVHSGVAHGVRAVAAEAAARVESASPDRHPWRVLQQHWKLLRLLQVLLPQQLLRALSCLSRLLRPPDVQRVGLRACGQEQPWVSILEAPVLLLLSAHFTRRLLI
jgi:hypothetical protein